MVNARTAAPRTAPHPRASLDAAIVARRYYLDDRQKSEIAAELGISRFKVARLLDDARASGIVRISVDLPTELDVESGDELARAFGLARALVVRVPDNQDALLLPLLGAAAADLLRHSLTPGEALGISWGASLSAVVDALTELPQVDVVQLVGGLAGADLERTSVELTRRLAQVSGGRAFPLHAPLLVGSASTAAALRADPSLADTVRQFGRLSVALVGIGVVAPGGSVLFDELSAAEREQLRGAGATAEICTTLFDRDGKPVPSAVSERSVGVDLNDLRAVPQVIAVAGGTDKHAAIGAALRSGIINTIVTDSATATALVS